MQRWTNNRWISSVHRVVVTSDNPSLEKYLISIAYFHQPNWNAVIRCIPSCINHNEKPFYLPIRSGTYLMRKFRSTTLWIDAELRLRCMDKNRVNAIKFFFLVGVCQLSTNPIVFAAPKLPPSCRLQNISMKKHFVVMVQPPKSQMPNYPISLPTQSDKSVSRC